MGTKKVIEMEINKKKIEEAKAEILETIKREGDRKEGTYGGFKYLILRMPYPKVKSFYINGYVAIPEGHVLYGRRYSDYLFNYGGVEISIKSLFDVHGGITLSGYREFEDGKHFTIGFDTIHAGDFFYMANDYIKEMLCGKSVYRTMDYVESECKRLIDQIALFDVTIAPVLKNYNAMQEEYKSKFNEALNTFNDVKEND